MCGSRMAGAVDDASPRLFWVYVRDPSTARFGSDRVPVRVNDVYSKYVRSELLAANLVGDGAGLTEDSPAREWSQPYEHLTGHVLGLMLCKPVFFSSLLLYLSRQQRHIQDYWQLTPYGDCPTLFLEVLASCTLEAPVRVYSGAPGQLPKGVFNQLTVFSAQRCHDTPVIGTRCSVAEEIARWVEAFNAGRAFAEAGLVQTCISMPTPHAMLGSSGRWKFWGLPLADGRRAPSVEATMKMTVLLARSARGTRGTRTCAMSKMAWCS